MKNAERLKRENPNDYLESTYYGEIKGNLLRRKTQYNFKDRNAFTVSALKIVDSPENAHFWAKTSDGKLWCIVAPKLSRSCISAVQDTLSTVTGLKCYATFKGKNWKSWSKKWGGNSYVSGY